MFNVIAAPFYPAAFTAHYTVDTGLVEIRLVTLPPEALEDEVIVMVLQVLYPSLESSLYSYNYYN